MITNFDITVWTFGDSLGAGDKTALVLRRLARCLPIASITLNSVKLFHEMRFITLVLYGLRLKCKHLMYFIYEIIDCVLEQIVSVCYAFEVTLFYYRYSLS
jgi:hypothetical protein